MRPSRICQPALICGKMVNLFQGEASQEFGEGSLAVKTTCMYEVSRRAVKSQEEQSSLKKSSQVSVRAIKSQVEHSSQTQVL